MQPQSLSDRNNAPTPEVGARTNQRSAADSVVDLTRPFYEGMATDDLGPKTWERLGYSYSRQLFQNKQSRAAKVFLTTDHTGTHIDGPLRFDRGGTPMEKISVEQLIRPALLVDLRHLGRTAAIGSREMMEAGLTSDLAGTAVVLWTAHDRYLKDPDYFWRRPQITEEGANWLASRRPAIVAADFPGFGAPSDDRYVIKRILHSGGCFTVEQLQNLSAVAGKEWHLFCGALPIRGLAGSIARVCALINWRATRIVDLTQEFFIGMPAVGPQPTYWLRASHAATSYSYDGALSYQSHSLFMSEHAGTHLDVPYHFKEAGRTIDQFDLNELLVSAKFFDMSHKKPLEAITAEDLEAVYRSKGYAISAGDAVVIHTGHSDNYHTRRDFGSHRQFISADGAAWIAAKKPAMVVTDLVGLDEPGDPDMPVHNQLLHGDVCMLQVTKSLEELREGSWQVAAFPINLVDGTAAPVRAFAAQI